MKKIALIGFILILTAGCAVTSEKYRYQQRFDKFFHLLSEEEKAMFRKADFAGAGQSIDARLLSDKKFSNAWRTVQFAEAITTFDGVQSIRFFYTIILRELNRPRYAEFMKHLDAPAAEAFVRNAGFDAVGEALIKKDNSFKSFLDKQRSEYRLYGFSNPEIFAFFRNNFPNIL